MKRVFSLLPKLLERAVYPLSISCDPETSRNQLNRVHEAGTRICAGIGLAITLLAGPVMPAARAAAPTITLTYQGDIGGVLTTAVLQFEDIRLPAGPPFGFYYSLDGRLCWQRVEPLDGRMYVGGYVSNAVDFYYLSGGEISGTSEWGYLTIVPTVGSSFLGRIDLPADANLVYLDQFALTANPLGPGNPTTYNFYFEIVATPTISPNGGSFPGPVQVTLACATADATMYYTTNGTTPTTSSAVYNAPFPLAASATVKVKSVKFGLADSAVASATFTVTPVAPSLTITRTGNSVTVSWLLSAQGYELESAGTLIGTNQWSVVGDPPATNGLFLQVTSPVSGIAKFYRLKK